MSKATEQQLRDLGLNLYWQPLLFMALSMLILFCLNRSAPSVLLWAAGSTSVIATAFIILITPHNKAASYRRVIGSYVIAFAIAELVSLVFHAVYAAKGIPLTFVLPHPDIFWFSAVIAMTLTVFVMIILQMGHPPAVGMSLVFILDIQSYLAVAILLGFVLLLTLIKYLLRDKLIDLVIKDR